METGYDYNRLIEALFDSDPLSGFQSDATRSIARHIEALAALIEAERDAAQIAAAAVLLAISLGYTPAVAFEVTHPRAMDPETSDMIKPAIPARKIDV